MASTGDLTGQLDLGRESVKAVQWFEPVYRTSSHKKWGGEAGGDKNTVPSGTLLVLQHGGESDRFFPLVMSRVSNPTLAGLSDNHALFGQVRWTT